MSFRTHTVAPPTKSDQNARSEVLWTAESRVSAGLANRTCTLVGRRGAGVSKHDGLHPCRIACLIYRLSLRAPSSRTTGHATAGPILYVMRMCFLR